MTEAAWNVCTDLHKMLEFVRRTDWADDRKLRLFAGACCQRIFPLLADERSRQAVEAAEQYADSRIGQEGLHSAHLSARRAYQAARTPASRASSNSAQTCSAPELLLRVDRIFAHDVDLVALAADVAGEALAFKADPVRGSSRWYAVLQAEQKVQCAVLRDLFGLLTFRPVEINPCWRTPTVVALATAVYEERRWQDLPILGDALQEAGCADEEVLAHCRGPGPHARGCWLVDLLLKKG
jgi:hypothetical protein